jgi:hypothetical protein
VANGVMYVSQPNEVRRSTHVPAGDGNTSIPTGSRTQSRRGGLRSQSLPGHDCCADARTGA